jgi:squalene-hopene/tetraprenyl-beta-curcumene cyclase
MSNQQAKTQSANAGSTSIHSATARAAAPRFGRMDADLADVESAIVRSREFLLSEQHPDGYWCGELEADSML